MKETKTIQSETFLNSRDKLLAVAFEEIYRSGYHATSIDKILKKANMNKGSMYFYFKSKKDLVITVINENLSTYIENKYSILLKYERNICDEMIKLINARDNFDFVCGCKLNNLMQELSPKDNDFKIALEKVYLKFESIIEKVLINAISNKEIYHKNIHSLAMYIVASIEGCLCTAKKSQDSKVFTACISQLEVFLKSLATDK